MAILASGPPIFHKAQAASDRTLPSVSLSNSMRAGIVALASGPIFPRASVCLPAIVPIFVFQQFRESGMCSFRLGADVSQRMSGDRNDIPFFLVPQQLRQVWYSVLGCRSDLPQSKSGIRTNVACFGIVQDRAVVSTSTRTSLAAATDISGHCRRTGAFDISCGAWCSASIPLSPRF